MKEEIIFKAKEANLFESDSIEFTDIFEFSEQFHNTLKRFSSDTSPSEVNNLINFLESLSDSFQNDQNDDLGIYIMEPIYDLKKIKRDALLHLLSDKFTALFWENQRNWHSHVRRKFVKHSTRRVSYKRTGFKSTRRIK